jgi:phosphoribosylamine---glycine ligase
MNILLLGSGGREHVLAWKLAQSENLEKLFIAPGNAGTMQFGTNLPISLTDFDVIAEACIQHKIAMVVVGPEEPLVKGIYDFLHTNNETAHIQVIGPSAAAAQLEGSKAFAKNFMQRNKIPTAGYREFNHDNFEEGLEYIRNHTTPVVLKADGLAAGKGVLICENNIEAMAEFDLMLTQNKFGEAGKTVVVEAFLKGIEFSVFVLTDGTHYKLLPAAKDYKRIGEGDTGLNTGGMGAISPVPFVDDVLMKKVEERVIQPTIKGLQDDKLVYCGFLYFGLMNVAGDPYVIEYNCRMGDPEAEVVLPRLKNDLAALLQQLAEGNLENINIETDPRAAATVVAVSGGYPGDYRQGLKITGLDTAPAEDTYVFLGGVQKENNDFVTSGGRVLTVTSLGNSISEAVLASNHTLRQISYNDMYYRHDIGYEFDS